MEVIKVLFDCVYKILQIKFYLFDYELNFLSIILCSFMLTLIIWFIGRVLE